MINFLLGMFSGAFLGVIFFAIFIGGSRGD